MVNGLIDWANQLFDLKLESSVQQLLTVVLFGVGTDYVLFLLFRYREALRAGHDPGGGVGPGGRQGRRGHSLGRRHGHHLLGSRVFWPSRTWRHTSRARARTGAPEAAAVRDPDGWTYVACTVRQPSFQLTPLQAVVAAAVSSGVTALEAAAVVTESDEIDSRAAADLNAKVLQVNPETQATRLAGT